MSKRIAYLINQYPKVSHSFIRREILALERQGFEIVRIALIGWDAEIVDQDDATEQQKTHYILQQGFLPVLWATMRTLIDSPVSFINALRLVVRVGWRVQRPLPYHLAYFAEACYGLQLLRSSHATHIHAHFGTNSAEVAMLMHALGGPTYSFTVHGQEELLFGGVREKVQRASFVVAISSFGRGLLCRRLEFDQWAKVKVVHCGLEDAFHNPNLTASGAPQRLVCVGRLSVEKGQLLLVEAADRLARMGIKFELVFAGDGEMRQELEQLIARFGLTEQVRITGWISSNQVRDQILAARALVLPSFTEGLPVVVMEAMALRRPVLATYVGGIPELVRPGRDGWLFPAGSVDDLVLAMADCLATPSEILVKMGEDARQRVIERHSVDSEAMKLAELFLTAADSERVVETN